MALDTFLTISPLKGDSADKNHVNDSDVLSFAWGASQSGTTHAGGGSGAGKASVQDFTITKYLDTMSVGLQAALFRGTHFPSVVVRSYKTGDAQLTYLTYEMSGVLVTSYVTAESGGEDRMTETVTFNFSKIKITTNEQTLGGKTVSNTVTFDVATNIVS